MTETRPNPLAALPQTAPGRADVLRALRGASASSGVDFGFLLKTAMRESSLDPTAKASTSSAAGLFQFTEATWLQMIDRYGHKHGLSSGALPRESILALRSDPNLSARMAAELTNENARHLEAKLGRSPSASELYAAHFLGPAGAARLIAAAQSAQTISAANMFPDAARANPSIFTSADGVALSPAQVLARLSIDPGGAAGVPINASGVTPSDTTVFAVRSSEAQMANALMSALLDLQADDGLADAFIGNEDRTDGPHWAPFKA